MQLCVIVWMRRVSSVDVAGFFFFFFASFLDTVSLALVFGLASNKTEREERGIGLKFLSQQ